MKDIIKKRHKEELIDILQGLVEVIALIRLLRDEYFYQKNEREAQDWLNYLKKHDNREELMSLCKEIVNRQTSEYSQIPDTNVTYEEIELMYKYLNRYKKYFAKYEYFQEYRPEYGLDIIRIFLTELYGIKSEEYIK